MRRTARSSLSPWKLLAVLAAALAACSSSAPAPDPVPTDDGGGSAPPPVTFNGYTVLARAGIADVGAGRNGLAVLATVRDESGGGPWEWLGMLADANGLPYDEITYDAYGPGSYEAWTFPDQEVGVTGPFELRLGPHLADLTTITLDPTGPSPIGVPRPRLSADGQRVEWAAVSGATIYRCEVTTPSTGGYRETFGAGTSCDVSTLPAGAHRVRIDALPVDLEALRTSTAQVPTLPDRFDVSSGRLGLLKPASGMPYQLLAAAGGYAIAGGKWVAIWASITRPDGAPAESSWNLSLRRVSDASATAAWDVYPASTARMVTRVTTIVTPDEYRLTATGTPGSFSVPVTIGALGEVGDPTGLTAEADAEGGATVSWTPASGAKAYRVRAFPEGTTSPVTMIAERWVAAPPCTFPAGTFTSGEAYEAYVIATDADMVAGTVPTRVAAAEPWEGAAFTAP